jgi:hypothetical protein
MADGGGRKIIAILQAVDLEYGASVFVDYFADPRYRDEVVVTDEVTLEMIYARAFADVVTVDDGGFSYTQEYNRFVADSVVMDDAATRVSIFERTLADGVTVTDNLSYVLDRVIALPLADSVTMGDALSMKRGDEIGFSDDVTASDAGFLSRYDYAAPDYFLTPTDYVGETRVF